MNRNNRFSRSRLLLFALIIVTTALFQGCASTKGTIHVSHPQVFTRERLIPAREKEIQYLKGRLDTAAKSTLAGAEDVRTLAGFKESLTATISPTAAAGVTSAEPVKSTDLAATLASPDSLASIKGIGAGGVNEVNDEMAIRDNVNAHIRDKELDDAHDRDGRTLYTLKFDTTLVPGDRTTQTAVVRYEMSGESFDSTDMADLYDDWINYLGSRRDDEEVALRSRLNHGQITAADESLAVELNNLGGDCFKVVDAIFEARRGTNCLSNVQLIIITNFVEAFVKFTTEILFLPPEARSAQINAMNSGTGLRITNRIDLPLEDVLTKYQSFETGILLRDTNQLAQLIADAASALKLERPEQLSLDSNRRLKFERPLDKRTLLECGMIVGLNARFEKDYAGLAAIEYSFKPLSPTQVSVAGKIVKYSPDRDAHALNWKKSPWRQRIQSEGLTQFKEKFKSFSVEAYADSMEPRIYAQNISDVSSQTKMLQLALSINAALGTSASLGNKSEYFRQTQTLLQAIKRRPLALSFSGEDEFGWYLGPTFEIKNGNATFSQVATRQAVAASVVVPSWWKVLTLKGTQAWLNSEGREGPSVNLPDQKIKLPRDFDALTAALLHPSERPRPTIFLSGHSLQVSTNEQTILIHGRGLWRNPAVVVGSTKADSVEILPNMQGLLAHFKSIPLTEVGLSDVSVFTSFGRDVLEKAVKITGPPKQAETNQPIAKLANSFAVFGKKPLNFTLADMPGGYAGFSLKLSTKDTAGKWQNVNETEAKIDGKSTAAAIQVSVSPMPAGPATYVVELGIRATPSANPTSLMPGSDSVFVFFPQADSEKPVMGPITLDYRAATTDQTINPLASVAKKDLYQAYPGLERAIHEGKAALMLVEKASNLKFPALPIKDAAGAGWSVVTTRPAGSVASGRFDAVSVEYPSTEGKTASIEVSGGPITIIGR